MMPGEIEFLEEEAKKAPGKTAMDEIMEFVDALIIIRGEIDVLEESLKQAQKTEQRLSGDLIPTYMAANGLEELRLANGKHVKVKEDVKASIPKDPLKRDAALSWLFENGGGDLVKDELRVLDPDAEFIEMLKKEGVEFERDQTVNTMSLMAWFREALGIKKGSVARIELSQVSPNMSLFVYRKTTIV
jgi:hypothetical protein